jgi:hypothetical protein
MLRFCTLSAFAVEWSTFTVKLSALAVGLAVETAPRHANMAGRTWER